MKPSTLTDKKYKTILVDLPWKYGAWGSGSNKVLKKSPHSHLAHTVHPLPYPVLSISEIRSLQIKQLADVSCELYLWTTQKYLPYSFQIIEHWGFKYCQTLTWCKTPRGSGQGGIYCPTTEFFILARVGKMPKVERIDSTWFHVKRPYRNGYPAHSTKPESFQDMIEKVSYPSRIELFASRKREGWDAIGYEIDGLDIRESLRKLQGD